MDIVTIAGDFKPLEDLLTSVRMFGTSEDPLFHLNDVAKYLEESHSERTTKDFNQELKVKISYKDGSITRRASFLTEDGLYEFIFLSKKPKGVEFKKMVRDILKQVRKHVYEKMQNKLKKAEEGIPAFPLPYDKEEAAKFHIKSWIQANTLDMKTSSFNYSDVSEYTYKCVHRCVKLGLFDEINIIMKQAYDAHVNSTIAHHLHFNKVLSKFTTKACRPERYERAKLWKPNVNPVFSED